MSDAVACVRSCADIANTWQRLLTSDRELAYASVVANFRLKRVHVVGVWFYLACWQELLHMQVRGLGECVLCAGKSRQLCF